MASLQSCFSTSLFAFTQGLSLDRHLHHILGLETRIPLARRLLPKHGIINKVRSSVVATSTIGCNRLGEARLPLEETAIALLTLLHFVVQGTPTQTGIIRIMTPRDNEQVNSPTQSICGDRHGENYHEVHLAMVRRILSIQRITTLVRPTFLSSN